MDRHTLTEGFIMYELLGAIAILSLLCMVFSGAANVYEPDADQLFPADYLLAQSAAMLSAQSTPLKSRVADAPHLSFSERGNVSKAMTLHLGRGDNDIIIELGPGKLVFR